MLNQILRKIKCFGQEIISNTTTIDNLKASQEKASCSYLAPLRSTNSALIDSHIQLITYFV